MSCLHLTIARQGRSGLWPAKTWKIYRFIFPSIPPLFKYREVLARPRQTDAYASPGLECIDKVQLSQLPPGQLKMFYSKIAQLSGFDEKFIHRPMFQGILIMAALSTKLISCSGHVHCPYTISKPPANEKSQCHLLQTIFRFSMGSCMFAGSNGIPYQYHIPRVDLTLADLNNGFVKIPANKYFPYRGRQAYAAREHGHQPTVSNGPAGKKRNNNGHKFKLRLAATARKLTDLERPNMHLWRRDPVPLNRFMTLLDSPVFLGNFFFALTSLTEVNGTVILSRFYYAPVLTARYGVDHTNSAKSAVSDMELNVFSVCFEPSDAPEDVSIPLMHRPQRIIDAGLRRSSHDLVCDARVKLRENATEKLTIAENHFANEDWDALFTDRERMAYRRPPTSPSPYDIIKTPFGDYQNDCLTGANLEMFVLHGYDIQNNAYAFAYGPGYLNGFKYDVKSSKLLIFLNPKIHFKDETELWGMCVDMWRQEMRARYGTDANSRLIRPHAYLSESASTAPYYEMLPRYEALGTPHSQEPSGDVGHSEWPNSPRAPRQRDGLKAPNKRKAKDVRSNPELLGVSTEPGAITGIGEVAEEGSPLKRYLPASAVQIPSEPNGIEKLADEPSVPVSEPENSVVLPEVSACCSTEPNILGAAVLSNDGSGSCASGC